MTTKGRMKYMPPRLIDEIEELKKQGKTDSEAMNDIVDYSIFGRETDRIIPDFIKLGRKLKKNER